MKNFISLLTIILVTGLSINSQLINKTNINTTVHSLGINNQLSKLQDSDLDNQIEYQALNEDKTLFSNNLVSNDGNTKGNPIITAKAKANASENSSGIGISISTEINKNKSYYVLGRVDSSNNFKETGKRTLVSEQQINIIPDGIYCLHITDKFNNEYTSFLELGKENWKLSVDFDTDDFNVLANLLNVAMPDENIDADIWLNQYKTDCDNAFTEAVKNYGRGFDIQVTSLTQGYKSFLDPITYVDAATQEAINQEKLIMEITDYISNLINSFDDISKELNVDYIKVVDKFTFDKYSEWINKYKKYFLSTKFELLSDGVDSVTREYADDDQIRIISSEAEGIPIKE